MDNPINAAIRGMRQGVGELNLVKKAEAAGYAGVAAHSGRSFKPFGCATCRRNTAIKFVHIIKKKAYLACHCGWRKKVSV